METDHAELDALGHYKEQLFQDAVKRDGVKLLPNAIELVKALAEQGFRQAIGSGVFHGLTSNC